MTAAPAAAPPPAEPPAPERPVLVPAAAAPLPPPAARPLWRALLAHAWHAWETRVAPVRRELGALLGVSPLRRLLRLW